MVVEASIILPAMGPANSAGQEAQKDSGGELQDHIAGMKKPAPSGDGAGKGMRSVDILSTRRGQNVPAPYGWQLGAYWAVSFL